MRLWRQFARGNSTQNIKHKTVPKKNKVLFIRSKSPSPSLPGTVEVCQFQELQTCTVLELQKVQTSKPFKFQTANRVQSTEKSVVNNFSKIGTTLELELDSKDLKVQS
jgi:hypothetical protein